MPEEDQQKERRLKAAPLICFCDIDGTLVHYPAEQEKWGSCTGRSVLPGCVMWVEEVGFLRLCTAGPYCTGAVQTAMHSRLVLLVCSSLKSLHGDYGRPGYRQAGPNCPLLLKDSARVSPLKPPCLYEGG